MEDYDHNPPRDQTNPFSKLYIITFNVKTLSSHERLIELSEAVKGIKYDIIGLAEVRRTGNQIVEYDDFILCIQELHLVSTV